MKENGFTRQEADDIPQKLRQMQTRKMIECKYTSPSRIAAAYSLEQEGVIALYGNIVIMCFKEASKISRQGHIYLGSNISSTQSDIKIHQVKE